MKSSKGNFESTESKSGFKITMNSEYIGYLNTDTNSFVPYHYTRSGIPIVFIKELSDFLYAINDVVMKKNNQNENQ